jgi:hypothetical protein
LRVIGNIVLLVFALLIIYIFAYLIDSTRYKSTELLRCSKQQKITISRASWPILSNYDFTNGLEVYIGGWLEAGNIVISGTLFRPDDKKAFSANTGLVEVSRARTGDWYKDNFTVSIKPDSQASCALKIIYKFRGI